MKRPIFGFVLAAVVLFPGCELLTKTDGQQVADQAQQSIAAAETELAAVKAQVEAIDDSALKAKWLKILAQVEAKTGDAQEALDRFSVALAAAPDDEAAILEAGWVAVSPFIPAPYSVAVGSILGLLIGLWRARQNRQTARTVISSAAKFTAIPPSDAVAIRMAQGSAGNRMVDEAQGKKTPLPF